MRDEAAWQVYKEAKEASVSGLAGSSIHRIHLVCATALVSYALWRALAGYSGKVHWVAEWTVLIVPLTLAATVLADCVGALLAGLGALTLAAAFGAKQRTTERRSERSPVLTVYRAYLMVLTVLCILAVDFPVFPRAFAKTETWGTSLMDLGVGSFVFSHGLVAGRPGSAWARLPKTWPLWALGLVRVFVVKKTGYPEHVAEYGVHWNFFLTLGVVLTCLDILRSALPRPTLIAVGVAVVAVHTYALEYTPLGAWSVSTARHGLVAMNKEGLVSLPGYLAIALCGLELGPYVRASPSPRALLKRTILYWSLYTLATTLGLVVSRRMVRAFLTQANLPYVLWTAAFNSMFLLGFTLLASSRTAPDTPRLLRAINRHGLVVFLLVRAPTDPGKSRDRPREPQYADHVRKRPHRDARARHLPCAGAGRRAMGAGRRLVSLPPPC